MWCQRRAQAVAAEQAVPGDRRHHRLRTHRRKRCPVQSPAQNEDENRVKRRLRQRRTQADQHGKPRAAESEQRRRTAIAKRQERQANQDDAEITAGKVQRLARRPDPGQHRAPPQPHCGGNRRHQYKRQQRQIKGITRRALLVAATNRLRDQRRGGDTKGYRNRADKKERSSGKADRRHQPGVAQAADEQYINKIDDERRHDADTARGGHRQQMPPQATFGKNRLHDSACAHCAATRALREPWARANCNARWRSSGDKSRPSQCATVARNCA